MKNDEIRRLTDLLARDPGSLAFRDLAEILRVRGDLDAAQRVALRGLERHSLDAEAHALLARISLDRGELQRAFDEWDMALRLSPRHGSSLKGLAFICYRWGRLQDAERYLTDAIEVMPSDRSLAGALENVRRARQSLGETPAAATVSTPAPAMPTPGPTPALSATAPAPKPMTTAAAESPAPEPGRAAVAGGPSDARPRTNRDASFPTQAPDVISPRQLFRNLVPESDIQAVLVDTDGLAVAGEFVVGGTERGQEVGAQLSGAGEEADRAMRHLGMGQWKSLSFETGTSVVAMTRASGGALVIVASPSAAPLGLLRRALDIAARTATAWLEGVK
jgi:predicted regulator of Ras-like GTPase activity (Roadblock/LC7/MglB family)